MRFPGSSNAVGKEGDIESAEKVLYGRSNCDPPVSISMTFCFTLAWNTSDPRTFSIKDLLLSNLCIINSIELKRILLMLMFRVRNPHKSVSIPQCSQCFAVFGVLLFSFVRTRTDNDIQLPFRFQERPDTCNHPNTHVAILQCCVSTDVSAQCRQSILIACIANTQGYSKKPGGDIRPRIPGSRTLKCKKKKRKPKKPKGKKKKEKNAESKGCTCTCWLVDLGLLSLVAEKRETRRIFNRERSCLLSGRLRR